MVLAALLSSCGDSESGRYHLDVDRAYRSPKMVTDVRGKEFTEYHRREFEPVELEDGFVRQAFSMSPMVVAMLQAKPAPRDDAPSDPFATPIPRGEHEEIARALARAGIFFPPGSSIRYDEADWTLVIVNKAEQIELVRAFFDSLMIDSHSRVFVRCEVYEMSRAHALSLIESGFHEVDHKPEREAARKAVRDGKAELVALNSSVTLSGQRGSSVVCHLGERPYHRAGQKGDPGDSSAAKLGEVPKKSSATEAIAEFEINPVLGADGSTIDLLFRLIHPISVGEARGEKASDDGRELHKAIVSTSLILWDGVPTLAGSWDSGPETTQIVFVTAACQSMDGIRPVVEVGPRGEDQSP